MPGIAFEIRKSFTCREAAYLNHVLDADWGFAGAQRQSGQHQLGALSQIEEH